MEILVLYSLNSFRHRKTIDDHLFCFRRYCRENTYIYVNVTYSTGIPEFLANKKYDGVIFHYSFLALRYAHSLWPKFYGKILPKLKHLSGVKVAIPQDEYNHTDSLRQLFRDTKTSAIFTCARESDFEKLYPSDIGHKHITTVFTGYIDDATINRLRRETPAHANRDIDIGYRARVLPYWLGRQGQIKTLIAEKLKGPAEGAGLKVDISTTNGDSKAYLGTAWIGFLLRCRTMLGCLGGSGLLDADGSIRESVEAFMVRKPLASFEEVERLCFPGKDGEISVLALSPRHFECAMTKTCQVLLEGDYQGVFIPGRHYIELKSDFSNIESVIEAIGDRKACEEIATICYKEVVESGQYRYSDFARQIVSEMMTLGSGTGKARAQNLRGLCWSLVSEAWSFYALLRASISARKPVRAIAKRLKRILKPFVPEPVWGRIKQKLKGKLAGKKIV